MCWARKSEWLSGLAIAALGLGAAWQLMGVWFDLVRYVGAAYLIWLGIKLFRSKGDLAVATERARPWRQLFSAGAYGYYVQPQNAGAVWRFDPAIYSEGR